MIIKKYTQIKALYPIIEMSTTPQLVCYSRDEQVE